MKNLFEKYKKKKEERETKKLATAGFIVGAIVATEDDSADADDVIIGGIVGVLAAGLFEHLFPKTTRIIKEAL